MQHKIMHKLKSEEGSSLAFVIIIGVVILMLVASIMAIANSDFTFTQQSLESRQAYIDAKSVIEYGKIEVNTRKKNLDIENTKLIDLNNQYKDAKENNQSTASIETEIAAKKSEIDAYMKTPYYIGGDENNVAETLKKVDSESGALGVLLVTSVDNSDGTIYTFKITTQNLRRKLDYAVNSNYVPSTYTTTTIGSTLGVPPDPTYNIPTSPWTLGQIGRISSDYTVSAKLHFSGGDIIANETDSNIKIEYPTANLKIDNLIHWVQGTKLNMTAHNICFTEAFAPDNSDNPGNTSTFTLTAKETSSGSNVEPGNIYFLKSYTQKNRGENDFTAVGGNVVINGNVEITNGGKLKITCKNLFINGSITLDPGNPGGALDITAENIVVTGDVALKSGTTFTTNCPNIWIGGNVSTYSSGDVLSFQNVNYLKAKDINLSQGCQFTVTGSNINSSQMIVNSIQPNDRGNAYNINITNLASFTCQDFSINNNSTVQLTSKIMMIQGITNFSWAGSVIITTQYLDCTGEVQITRLGSPLNIKAFDGQSLNIRFAGSYSQIISTVNINGADLVIFGGSSFVLDGDNKDSQAVLKVAADNIYLDTASINIDQFYGADRSNFYYTGKNNNATNFHLKTSVNWDSEDWHNYKYPVNSGVYNTIKGQFPEVDTSNWLYKMTPDPYQGPEWDKVKLPVGSSSVTVTVTNGSVANGLEKYY